MKTLIKNANIVNENERFKGSILISGEFIEKVIKDRAESKKYEETPGIDVIDATDMLLIHGVIDYQVHFREPGLTHKGDLLTESKAAVAGGITSLMEMPNTDPKTVTKVELEKKFRTADKKCFANYSFYFGATNDNFDEVMSINPERICGVKVFMGSSTGNMLVNNDMALKKLFSQKEHLLTTHCEDEQIVKANLKKFRAKFGEIIAPRYHPEVRNHEACIESTKKAVGLAQKYGARLHVLHISTAEEVAMFDPGDIESKQITAEACIHHIWFCDEDYKEKGNRIKWNPAIKWRQDRDAIRRGIIEGRLDIIATDHAPHTWEEKNQLAYIKAPAGGPMVQHALVAMLDLYHQRIFSLETIVERMCHAPAKRFQVKKRGFIRDGYYADMVMVDLNSPWGVDSENILYKCNWSPFEGYTFKSKVITTWINGHQAYHDGKVALNKYSSRLEFDREKAAV